MAYQVQAALTGSGLAGAGREYTADLWDGFDPMAMDRSPGLGQYYQTNFLDDCPVSLTNLTTSVIHANGRYTINTDATGATMAVPLIQCGGVNLACTTDNNAAAFQLGAVGELPFALVTSNEVTAWPYHHLARIRFECRVRNSNVAANVHGWFIGLAGVLATADLDNDTADVVTTKPFFGWSVLNGAAAENATPRFVYQNATAAPTVLIANCGTMVADTWYRLGFDYNPMAPASQRCAVYFNGVKSNTYLTQTMTATNFPRTVDGTAMVGLTPTFINKPGATTAAQLTIASFRICQEIVGVAQGNEACS